MKRLFSILISISCLFLFNASCEDDLPTNSSLEVTVETTEITSTAEDTIWFNATFSNEVNRVFSIAEGGGLATIYVFAIDSSSNSLTAAAGINLIIDRGSVFQGDEQLDDAGHYFNYQCPNAVCDFRVGITLAEVGLYLIKPQGLGFETTTLNPDVQASNYAFSYTWVNNRPDYATLVPWTNDRIFQYELSTGGTLSYQLEAFDGPVLIEVE